MIAALRFLTLMICCVPAINSVQAQVSDVRIGVNGLTCSQCTRNVEMSLRKLPFVQDVAMNLQHTDGNITLRPNSKFDAQAIVKAVKAAGFSLRFLKARVNFASVSLSEQRCFLLAGESYQLTPTPEQQLSGTVPVQFVGDGFLPPGELRKWKPRLVSNCFAQGNKHYFITLQTDPG